MHETRYACEQCGAMSTEAEYRDGETNCGTQGCPRFGKPLEKVTWCVEHGHICRHPGGHHHDH